MVFNNLHRADMFPIDYFWPPGSCKQNPFRFVASLNIEQIMILLGGGTIRNYSQLVVGYPFTNVQEIIFLSLPQRILKMTTLFYFMCVEIVYYLIQVNLLHNLTCFIFATYNLEL